MKPSKMDLYNDVKTPINRCVPSCTTASQLGFSDIEQHKAYLDLSSGVDEAADDVYNDELPLRLGDNGAEQEVPQDRHRALEGEAVQEDKRANTLV